MRCTRLSLPAIFATLVLAPPAMGMPKWAKVAIESAADAQHHPDASVLIVHKSAQSKVSKGGTIRTLSRYVVKILREDGLGYGRLHEYISPTRKVREVRGWILRPDGSEKRLGKDQIVEMEDRATSGYYDDQRILVAAWPRLEVGSYVVFELDVERDSWFDPYDVFYFQYSFDYVLYKYNFNDKQYCQYIYDVVYHDHSASINGGGYLR